MKQKHKRADMADRATTVGMRTAFTVAESIGNEIKDPNEAAATSATCGVFLIVVGLAYLANTPKEQNDLRKKTMAALNEYLDSESTLGQSFQQLRDAIKP